MRVAIVVAAVALVGCAKVESTPLVGDMNALYEQQARKLLLLRVSNPESLQISRLEAAQVSGGIVLVCGHYSTRSEPRAQPTRSPFFMMVDATGGAGVGWEPIASSIIVNRCAQSGMSLT